MTHKITEDVTLHINGEDSVFIDAPFGFDVNAVEAKLFEWGYALIHPDEAEPELISSTRQRIWCWDIFEDTGVQPKNER